MIRKIPAESLQSYKTQGFPVYADMCPCDGGFEVCQWEVTADFAVNGPIKLVIDGTTHTVAEDYVASGNPSLEEIETAIRSAYLKAGYIEDGVKDYSILTMEVIDGGAVIKITFKGVPPTTQFSIDTDDYPTTVKCTPAVLCEYPVIYSPDNGVTQSVLTIDGAAQNIPAHEAGVTAIATIESDIAALLDANQSVSVVYDAVSAAYTVTIISVAGTEISLTSGGTERTAEECNCKDGFIA